MYYYPCSRLILEVMHSVKNVWPLPCEILWKEILWKEYGDFVFAQGDREYYEHLDSMLGHRAANQQLRLNSATAMIDSVANDKCTCVGVWVF